MTSPSRPRLASFASLARSSASTRMARVAIGAAFVLAGALSAGCSDDDSTSSDGFYTGGGYGSGGGTYTSDGGTVSTDGGVALPFDASTTTTFVDAGSAPGADAGDGGGPTTCTGFANCAVGEACNAGLCTACGGDNGPCPCTTTAQCGTGLECVANACTPTAAVCHYQTDCASGDVCDDGQCVSACTTTCAVGTCAKGACTPPASTGTSCSDDTACAGTSSPFCVDGHCAPACGGDAGACATGFTCNQGACVTDTGPAVECTDASQCSVAGQTCVHNLCKFVCTASTDCLSHDSRFPACASDGVCRTAAEANPQCTSASLCAPGQDCIDNTCQ